MIREKPPPAMDLAMIDCAIGEPQDATRAYNTSWTSRPTTPKPEAHCPPSKPNPKSAKAAIKLDKNGTGAPTTACH